MKHLLLYLLLLTCSATLSAQAPQMLNYQGVARSTNGSPLSNQSIKLRLSIQPVNGNPFFVETHNVTTNQFGLYAVQIGQGAVVSGNFANISWAQNTTFLQVEMDPAGGNNFTQVGIPTQLISVPYSLEAQHAASTTLGGDVTGSSNANTVTAIQNRPVASTAPATGDVLKWNGSQWQPGTDATSGGGAYSAGSGISISGNVISNEGDLDNYNELQTMYLIGNTLTLSDGGGSVTLPTGVNYNEGVGIEINGNTISNAGDLDNTNELQSISLSGNVLTLSDGGGSVTLPSGGGGFSLPYVATQSNSNSLIQLTNTGSGGAFHGISTGGGEPAIWGEDPNGVYAGIQGSSTSGDGVIGSSGSGTGIWGQSNSSIGIYAESFSNTALKAVSYGGYSTVAVDNNGAFSGVNVFGTADHGGTFVGDFEEGVWASGSYDGYYGYGGVNGAYLSGDSKGVYAFSNGANGYGGYFDTRLYAVTMQKGSGSFKIDHPLDPENKFLYHSFVESPDMMNVYNGNITTDSSGRAKIELPSYFEALNRDFRYQLTCIGTFAQVIVEREVSDNSFSIRSDKPTVKVSWQVTGIRKDSHADSYRIIPEVEKQSDEKGKYLCPECFGQPESKGMMYEERQRAALQAAQTGKNHK